MTRCSQRWACAPALRGGQPACAGRPPPATAVPLAVTCQLCAAVWHRPAVPRPRLQRLGVDVDKLLLCQPDSGEMALEVADSLIRRAQDATQCHVCSPDLLVLRPSSVCGAGCCAVASCFELLVAQRSTALPCHSTAQHPSLCRSRVQHTHTHAHTPVPRCRRSSAVDMVAVDSVAALVPRAELEGEIGQLQGEHGRASNVRAC